VSLPKRIAAYEDCFELLDHAVKSGARAKFRTYPEAHIYGLRLNYARSLRAVENQRLYPKEHPSWGKTDYDHLIIRKPREDEEGCWWVYAEPAGAEILSIETLGEEATE
jgi:hypothetical protein